MSKKIPVSAIFIFALTGATLAARADAPAYVVYFSAPKEVPLGAEFPVRILVDSGQPLNAYDISLNYSSLEVLGFNNSRSIIDAWQRQPSVWSGGGIEFNGGSLAPFQGSGGEMMTVNFRAVKEGTAQLGFEKAALYLANGKGTEVVPREQNFSIAVLPAASSSAAGQFFDLSASADNTPPAIKFLSIVDDPVNPDQKLVSFFVGGGGSGVKEVSLRVRSYFLWGDWQAAQNPAAVPNSVWAADFKVTDNSGNFAEKVVYDWRAFWRFALIVSSAAGIILLLILMIKKGRQHNPPKAAEI